MNVTLFCLPAFRHRELAAENSNGARLRIHGEDFPVRAEIQQLQSASSHADASEMLAWMSTLTEAPRRMFITHGEPGASDALRQRIERELGWAAHVPEHLQSFDLALSS